MCVSDSPGYLLLVHPNSLPLSVEKTYHKVLGERQHRQIRQLELETLHVSSLQRGRVEVDRVVLKAKMMVVVLINRS